MRNSKKNQREEKGIMKENRKLLREVLNDIRHDKVNAILAKQSALERQVREDRKEESETAE